MASTYNSQNVINCIKRRKGKLIQVLGGKCCICGFDSYQEALDFHHVHPEEKSFQLSGQTTKNLPDQLNELRKCVLLCSNCHRGVHAGYLQIPENYKDFYDEELAKKLLQENDEIRHGKISLCPRCGKPKTKDAEYCLPCTQFMSRIVERPDRETLKQLIRTTPFTTIGRIYGVTDNAVRKWCKYENLPYQKADIRKYTDEEWLEI